MCVNVNLSAAREMESEVKIKVWEWDVMRIERSCYWVDTVWEGQVRKLQQIKIC